MDDLKSALARHELQLDDRQAALIQRYCEMLWDHNTRINLTRHSDWEQFVTRDLVDTLKLSQLIAPAETVLDIGSGGGVPGLVLAILRPDLRLTLCESVGKKARVLSLMVEQLGLPVEVFDCRAETLLDDFRFSVCIARAVGPLEKLCRWFRGNWYSLGRLLAVKGPRWSEEKAAVEAAGLMKGIRMTVAAEYPIPGQEWNSTIVKIWPVQLPEPGPNLVESRQGE